ncbi:aminotransferase class I/II-fold pyridoxal phosphate-dependent enzyme [Micrococcus luteus]|uniref:DegT/DnrJ/EryC1/StrS family aminotransferase n=1 Tax=Micrococcus TaxID=1269 RepID=UPI0019D2BB65|nr:MULTISPECIES: aminotransferase class I/II-fold pyridoxal phosphate-dependent enzyme [Micrococcus]MCV7522701.1 aminotransferase class I/II-fold pyridoxal phosphate-dependent enzyme [Micrococcus luteus]MCV7674069.1 aminotransferase class I/II-fold pyridoxal phosphate-dependent enzyme [Micrococcus luteus]MCV7696611.1 aminotransferase class I/II-fold pyridoxal phosphate-dependent enzyme [Micrococcus luteus]
MSEDRILMSTPDVGPAEEAAVVAAIRSGWIAPLGPDVDAFEGDMAARLGVGHAVALSSGTAALHLGLLTLGVGPGDVVVTSSMTFAATANVIEYTGATPYFVDCLEDSGNMDPALLEQVLGDLRAEGRPAAALVPVDLLGKACDYGALLPVAEAYGVPVLCDAAESLGASHDGVPTGRFGRASAFSFNGNKILTTSGGGMLVTDDEAFANRVRYLATQARQPVVHYEHTDIGYNYRLSNLLAALGRAQLSRLDEMMDRRRRWREGYRELVAQVDGVEVFGGDDEEDNCWLTSIVVDPAVAPQSAEELRRLLDAAHIESRPLWKPMHRQPVFADRPSAVTGAADRLFATGLTLPSGSAMTPEAFDRVRTVLAEAWGL